MKRIFGFFLKPAVLVVLGALCLALLVWFAGPLLAFAGWHPLESVTARVVCIVALLALWLGKRLVQALRERLANRRMLEAMTARDAKPAADENAEQLEAIRQRFTAAMAVLKQSRFGQKAGVLERLFGGRRYAYQLPWYLFIGAPGSGKTTALLNAGLQFPLAESLGNDPIQGVGGTRQCDWWFTDQAVMIDTAGRYTTQDSDAQADAGEWKEFLKSLKRHRPRQPINGALVTVSVGDLLQLSGAERQAQAAAVRQRVQELLATLENQFPIYLLVTKADLLPGFMEFFGDLDREARDQVWGTTFEFNEKGASVPNAAQIDADLEALVARIADLTLDRLQSERDPTRRAAIQGFAQQVATLRPLLSAFLAEAFPRSQLAQPPMLRGVYFTSGTQEGSPIDRVMGSLARQFGLQRRMLAPLRPSGRSFFLSRLLHGVIFPEAGLAGTNLRWERRLGTLKWAASIGALVIGLGAAAGWSLSFVNNAAYVADVGARVEVLKKELAGQVASTIELRRLLPLYERVRGLARTERVDPDAPGITHSLGLFQGGKLAAAADQAYHRLLAQTLAPLLAERMATALKQTASNPVLQYENLKAYVMLREPDRLDPAALRGWIAFDLEAQRNVGLSAEEQRALLTHVDALLSRSAFQDSVIIDTNLITQARASLAATPFPRRVYERLKRQGVGDIADFRLVNAGGPATSSAFDRISKQPLTAGVPALYTYNGYHKGFVPQLDDTLKVLAEEEVWVLGIRDSENARRAADAKGRESLIQEVKRLYLLDYATTWEQFIGDITLRRGGNLTESIAVARLLSAPDSPVLPVLRAIVREVSLTETGSSVVDKAVGKASDAIQGTKERLERLLGPNTPVPPPGGSPKIEALVDDRFATLRAQVRAPEGGGPAPIEKSLAMVNDLYQHLLATEQAGRESRPPPPSEVPLKIKGEAGRLPEPLRGMLTALVTSGTAQASGQTREVISRQMAALGEACSRLIGGRYPFARDSRSDVTPEDFARVFSAGSGLLDEFFQKNLAALVDTQVKPWKFRDAAMGDSGALRQFQHAAEIRDVFFGGGARGVQMRIEFRPVDMDTSLSKMVLNVDGQELPYQFGPQVPKSMQWPGPGGTNQIRLQVTVKDPPKESQLLFEGPWALFRMFDRAQIESSGQPDKFRATFSVDGKRVQFDVATSSVRNPFRLPDLQAFQCPRGL